MMNSISHIDVPCRKATEAAKAAHVCQLIASDHGQMRGGEGFYDQFYLRDAANQLLALEEAGHIEMARNAIKYFLQRQQADGRFAGGGNQGVQFDANAFPEGIYADRREAWGNTIPHVTGACNFVFMLRHMLIHEAGDELYLLRAVPDWWLDDGQEIRVERAPTHSLPGYPAGHATAPFRQHGSPSRRSDGVQGVKQLALNEG